MRFSILEIAEASFWTWSEVEISNPNPDLNPIRSWRSLTLTLTLIGGGDLYTMVSKADGITHDKANSDPHTEPILDPVACCCCSSNGFDPNLALILINSTGEANFRADG